MDLRDHITALAATADRIGLGYSRDAARAVHHHVDELRDALDEHALKVTAAIREAHAAKDAEIERLRAELALHEAAAPATNDLAKRQRERAEQAEAERDRLRARLTGVSIHAHRLTKRIGPGTPAWTALADLRAALDQPGDQEGTTP